MAGKQQICQRRCSRKQGQIILDSFSWDLFYIKETLKKGMFYYLFDDIYLYLCEEIHIKIQMDTRGGIIDDCLS